jgi:hypothetical protein
MRKLVFVVACSGVLAACGGSSGGGFKDPDSVDFSYGSATEVTPGSDAYYAAGDAVSGLEDVSAIQGQGADDSDLAEDVISLPNEVAGALFGSGLPFLRAMERSGLRASSRAAALLTGDTVAAASGWDDEGCWTVTATSIQFDHCTISVSEDDSTMVTAVNGSMHRAAGHVYWDLTATMTITGTSDVGPMTIKYSDHATGDVTFDAGTIVGFERSDLSLSAKAPTESISMKVTYNVDLDLQYLADPSFCLTGGTLEAKQVWSEKPSNPEIDPADFVDQAVKLTWQENGGACSTAVLVAWGTPE